MAEPPKRRQAADADQSPSTGLTHLAYAEAAIMLLECLMLKLMERQVLTLSDLENTVQAAIDTKRQMAEDGEHRAISAVASGLLVGLANSLAASKQKAGGNAIRAE